MAFYKFFSAQKTYSLQGIADNNKTGKMTQKPTVIILVCPLTKAIIIKHARREGKKRSQKEQSHQKDAKSRKQMTRVMEMT